MEATWKFKLLQIVVTSRQAHGDRGLSLNLSVYKPNLTKSLVGYRM
jgi:hypothetical protein